MQTKQCAGNGSGSEFNLEACDSPARLIQHVVRALNIPVSKLDEPAQKMLREENEPASILTGKKVLIVDDDIRNIFALTSILERYDMVTISAETGRDAIRSVASHGRCRYRADGYHDARNGRAGHNAHDSANFEIQRPADCRGHRQGHERGSRKVHRSGAGITFPSRLIRNKC